MTYRVRDWERLFETSETRKRKFLSWVLVPNSHDSLGFCQLMGRPDGLEVFAVWCLVLQLASRCTVRGTLASGKGKPYSSFDISTMVRAPVDKVEPALDILIEVGWLESATSCESHADTLESHADTSGNDSAGRRTKKEREERKKERTPPTPQGAKGRGSYVIPNELDHPEFHRAWEAWVEYRQEMGKPLLSSSAKAQLDDLVVCGPAMAVERIKSAIMRSWQAPANLEGKEIAKTVDPVIDQLGREVRRLNKETP